MKIGILALQGAFIEHEAILRRLGAEVVEVRLPEQLADLDGLIIPGGESTTMGKLMAAYALEEPIREFARSGKPLWGTCAGMIVIAKDIEASHQPKLGLMDITVSRNAFGRQVDSFEQDIDVPALGGEPFPAVFIRAPLLLKVGDGVQVLARLSDGRMVAAEEGPLLVTAFHPELTPDTRFHEHFLDMVRHHAAGKDRGPTSTTAQVA